MKKWSRSLAGADGVVVSSDRLSKPGALNKRQLELPRPLLFKDASQPRVSQRYSNKVNWLQDSSDAF